MKKQERANEIIKKLKKLYPDVHCELDYRNPYELLIATILSAQTTDVQVNRATPSLFKKYMTPKSLSEATINDVIKIIKSTGFYKNKANNIVNCAKQLTEDFNGTVPENIKDLITLSGVGRKTANVVLGNAFNINEGIAVDTHVKRLSKLFKFTSKDNPIDIEKDLMKLFSKSEWTLVSHLLIFHGRRVCSAKKPDCANCSLEKICPDSKI
jgi:endonuclease III